MGNLAVGSRRPDPLFSLAVRQTFWIGLIVLVGCQSAAFALCRGDGEERSPQLEEAIALYDRGWAGNDEALLEAVDLLSALARGRDASALERAYYGSASVARARTVPDWRKRRWLERGADELDAAVDAAPESLQVKLLRAKTFAILPRLAGRAETVEEDFDWLIERALDDEPALDDACRQTIFYHAGSFAVRNRDARALAWLEKAVEIGGEGQMEAERVKRMLQLARRQFSSEDRPTYDE